MKALILAAGLGSRLGDLSKSTPKILQKINGTSILEINLRKLSKIGVKQFFVNTHYLSELVEEEILKLREIHDVTILYEPRLLGTLGTLKKLSLCENIQDLLVMHGDNYFEDSLTDFNNAIHNLKHTDYGLIATFRTNKPEECGILETDTLGNWVNFHEKSQNNYGNLANAAIYYFKYETIHLLKNMKLTGTDISRDLLPRLVGKLKIVELEGQFIDIGTPENLEKANNLIK